MQGNMEIYDSQMDFIFAFEFAFPGTRSEKVYKGAKFKIQTQSPLGWLEFCKNEPNVLYLNFELFGTRSGERTQPQNST